MSGAGQPGQLPFGAGDQPAAAPGEPLHERGRRFAVQGRPQPHVQRRRGQRRQRHGAEQRYRRGRFACTHHGLQQAHHPGAAGTVRVAQEFAHLGAVDVGVGQHQHPPPGRALDGTVGRTAEAADLEAAHPGQLAHLGEEPAVPGPLLAGHPQRAAPEGLHPDEEVARDGHRRVPLQQPPGPVGPAHRQVVADRATTAPALGQVVASVGDHHQGVAVSSVVRIGRQPEADRHPQRRIAGKRLVADAVHQPCRHLHRLRAGGFRQYQDELVAAVAHQQLGGADHGHGALGDSAQHAVSAGVAVRVVDDLEVVDVEDGDRAAATGEPGPRDRRVHAAVQAATCHRTRQRVGEQCAEHTEGYRTDTIRR